jgi:hypothetical protein
VDHSKLSGFPDLSAGTNLKFVGKVEVSCVKSSPAGNDGNAGLEQLTLFGQLDGLDFTRKKVIIK